MPSGLAFPLQIEGGRFKVVEGTPKLRQNVGHIISTEKRERVMEPDMGSNAYKGILRALNNDSAQAIAKLTQEEVNKQEPRMVCSLELYRDSDDGRFEFLVKGISKLTREAVVFEVEVNDAF